MNIGRDDIERITLFGAPAWRLPDGRVMPVVGGGSDDADPPADDDAGGDPPAGDDDPDPAAEAAKWKALARKHEGDAKKNADAAKKLQEIEDAKKSEIEKLTDAQKAAEQRATDAELRALRLEVAAEKGLTPAQAKRLVGATKEELETDADELLESFKADDDDSADTGLRQRPRERLRSGLKPRKEPEKDVKEVVAGIPRSRF